MKRTRIKYKVVLMYLLLFLSTITNGWANLNDPLILFVGEAQSVLSIASGREESAWQAPAVAQVLEQKDLRQRHKISLTEALDDIPGFYMGGGASKIHSHLRGIPESTLYLYDTVPMKLTTDIPLHSVKRIEIVRGPGSVLWGPDAFAGIVNLVPLTGKDMDGTETGMMYSSEYKTKTAYINHGWNKNSWDGFLSVSAGVDEQQDFSPHITRFWDGEVLPVPVEERRGNTLGETGHQSEIVGNLSINDNVKLSTRISDNMKSYALSAGNDNVSWKETRETTNGFFKIEAKKRLELDSALRFTGSVSFLDTKKEIVDITLDNDAVETYGEMTYEQVLNSGRAHFTAGVSFRDTEYNGVTIWDTYFPDFLVDENDAFLPTFTQEDYRTKLVSLFTQYRMTLGSMDLILGIRHDDHDSFEDNLSYNTGIVWSPSEDWVCKLLTGTAYRTPSPRELFVEKNQNLEEIRNITVEVSRKFGKKVHVSLGGFINQIDDHIMDIPYDGISTPNSQTIKGIEFSGSVSLLSNLSLTASFTLLENQGPQESFLNLDYSTLLPDGTLENHYTPFEYPYDSGPDRFCSIDALWMPARHIEVFARTRYSSAYELSGPFAADQDKCESVWLLDGGFRVKDMGFKKSVVEIKFENLLDKDYTVPGEYGLVKGAPFSVGIVWRKVW